MRQALTVLAVSVAVATGGAVILRCDLPLGPLVVVLGFVPLAALGLARRRLSAAVPDLVFGGIDTGLLVIPALAGCLFGSGLVLTIALLLGVSLQTA